MELCGRAGRKPLAPPNGGTTLRTIRPSFANSARFLVLCLIVTAGLPASAGTITSDLKDALVSAGPDDFVPVVVMMEEYPARAELMREVRGLNRESRRDHVVSRLRALSRRTQQPVRAVLTDLQDETRRVRVSPVPVEPWARDP